MYEHIVIAVDGSDTSNLALQEAIRLAKEQKAALRLVHVADETPPYVTTDIAYALPDFQKIVCEAGQKVLATCAATARQTGVKVDTKLVILEVLMRRICDAINEEARGWPAQAKFQRHRIRQNAAEHEFYCNKQGMGTHTQAHD